MPPSRVPPGYDIIYPRIPGRRRPGLFPRYLMVVLGTLLLMSSRAVAPVKWLFSGEGRVPLTPEEALALTPGQSGLSLPPCTASGAEAPNCYDAPPPSRCECPCTPVCGETAAAFPGGEPDGTPPAGGNGAGGPRAEEPPKGSAFPDSFEPGAYWEEAGALVDEDGVPTLSVPDQWHPYSSWSLALEAAEAIREAGPPGASVAVRIGDHYAVSEPGGAARVSPAPDDAGALAWQMLFSQLWQYIERNASLPVLLSAAGEIPPDPSGSARVVDAYDGTGGWVWSPSFHPVPPEKRAAAINAALKPNFPVSTLPPSSPFAIQVTPDRHEVKLVGSGVTWRTYTAGMGTPETPTPLGDFVIGQMAALSKYDGDSLNPFGTRWMRWMLTDGTSTDYGFHGTDRPETIGTDVSLGCVTLGEADLEELYRLTPRGTLIQVRQSWQWEQRQRESRSRTGPRACSYARTEDCAVRSRGKAA